MTVKNLLLKIVRSLQFMGYKTKIIIIFIKL